jgi:hypothetical protein
LQVAGFQSYNADNTGKFPKDAMSDKVPAKAYGMRLNVTEKIVGEDDGYDEMYESHFYLPYGGVNINIYSLSDFDSSHPALSSLNKYFFALQDTTTGYFIDSLHRVSGILICFLKWTSEKLAVPNRPILMH